MIDCEHSRCLPPLPPNLVVRAFHEARFQAQGESDGGAAAISISLEKKLNVAVKLSQAGLDKEVH